MTPPEAARLLAVAAAFDRRTVGDTDVMAWHAALGHLDHDDCRDAIIAHYRDNTTWVMPAHITAHVKAARSRAAEHAATAKALELPPANPGARARATAALAAGIGNMPQDV